MRTLFPFCFCLLFFFEADGQDTVSFEPVEVLGERIQPPSPYRVSRIDSSALDQHAFQDLGDLLEERSALQVRRYGPSGAASLSFRGTRSNETRMYWNGLSLRSPTLGQSDLSLVPAFFLDRVNLHHGGASSVDGTGGIGGSIHLRSGMDRTVPWRVNLQGRIASFGDRMGGFDLVRNKGNFGSRTRLFYRSADNDFPYPDISEKGAPIKERKNAGIQRMGAMQDLRYELGNGHRLFASGWYFRSSRDIPTPIDQVERGQHQEDRKLNSMVGWSWNASSTEMSFRSGYFFNDLVFTERISDLRSVTTAHSWRSRYQVEHRLDEKRRISASWSYDLDQANSSGYPSAKQRIRTHGYIQFENRFAERALVTAQLQEQWVDGKRVPLMPTIGGDLLFSDAPELHLKANVSRTYRVPTLNDLYWEPGGDPDLRPQEGWSYEGGLAGEFFKKEQAVDLDLEMTVFFLEMNDRIVWAPTSSGYWSPKNIDRSKDRGVEFSVGGRSEILDGWVIEMSGDYSYVDAQVIDQVEGEEAAKGQAIYVPDHRGSATISLRWREKNSLSYGIGHTGERYIDRDNLRYLPAYTLQRVHIQRKLRLRDNLLLVAKAGVRNLFDIPYHSVAWHPMPGRSFELNLRLSIGP